MLQFLDKFLEIQGRNYFDVTLGVVPDLCSDIVLGQSLMNKHKVITFKLNGTQEGLVIQNPVYNLILGPNYLRVTHYWKANFFRFQTTLTLSTLL